MSPYRRRERSPIRRRRFRPLSLTKAAKPAPKADPGGGGEKGGSGGRREAKRSHGDRVRRGRQRFSALIGLTAPAEFLSYFMVFVLAVIVGYYVILERHASPAHTAHGGDQRDLRDHRDRCFAAKYPVRAVLVLILAAIAVLIASINISGGFLVTRRMLAMFQKS